MYVCGEVRKMPSLIKNSHRVKNLHTQFGGNCGSTLQRHVSEASGLF